ncbi:hypothetical protein V8E54_006462 [Elaphomyces granulatus]
MFSLQAIETQGIPPYSTKLFEIIRNDATPEEIRAYIDRALATIQSSDVSSKAIQETATKLKGIRRMINLQGPSPSFRRKVMNVSYLCSTPPIRVCARPWTTVTDDDDLVSHLVSLYFTWDYLFYAFLDRDVFVGHMSAGDHLCTPFLVNAILANACLCRESVQTLTTVEALLGVLREEKIVSLATLQGTLLLYEWYSIFGDDDNGYTLLNRAIDIAITLGYIGVHNSSNHSELDTVVHTGFLKPNRIRNVCLKRLSRAPAHEDSEHWVPYSLCRLSQPAYFSQYFDESCILSEIASKISRHLFEDDENLAKTSQLRETLCSLYGDLKYWHDKLPNVFDPSLRHPGTAHSSTSVVIGQFGNFYGVEMQSYPRRVSEKSLERLFTHSPWVRLVEMRVWRHNSEI